MDRRFICQDCGTKWFVPEGHEAPVESCARCDGPLLPLIPADVSPVAGVARYGLPDGAVWDD
jgi:hypothetical protein